jgi:hypothetical protein
VIERSPGRREARSCASRALLPSGAHLARQTPSCLVRALCLARRPMHAALCTDPHVRGIRPINPAFRLQKQALELLTPLRERLSWILLVADGANGGSGLISSMSSAKTGSQPLRARASERSRRRAAAKNSTNELNDVAPDCQVGAFTSMCSLRMVSSFPLSNATCASL